MAVFKSPKDDPARVFSSEGATGEGGPEADDVASLHSRREEV